MNTSHYPSLELCKEATELGFPITHTVWCMHYVITDIGDELPDFEYVRNAPSRDYDKDTYICEAPNVMEILDELQHWIWTWKINDVTKTEWNYQLCIRVSGNSNNFVVSYELEEWDAINMIEWALPDALLSMWIWLKKEGLLPNK